MLLYHHSRELEHVVCGEVKAHPDHHVMDEGHTPDAYKWLEAEVGFYPIYLAVGTGQRTLCMTDYQGNWRRIKNAWLEKGKLRREYYKPGKFPNRVLFSFNDVEGIFMDMQYWEVCGLSASLDEPPDKTAIKRMFKKSWPKSRWLRYAKKYPSSVQLITGKLDLSKADRLWVRNRETKAKMEDKGFKNVQVRRLVQYKF